MSSLALPRRMESGFSMIELLVSVLLASIIFAAMVPMFVGAQQKAVGDQVRNTALNLAQDHIEKIRQMPFDQIVSGTNLDTKLGTTWDSYGEKSSKRYFIAHTAVPNGSSPTSYYTVTVTVRWNPPPSPVKEVVLKTIVVNQAAVALNPTAAAPTVASFTPSAGPVGTSVALTGTNFTGATKVTFNGTNAPAFTVVSATQITATVPAGATSGTVAVTTPAGSGTSAGSFTVGATPALTPTVTSFSPASGAVGTAVILTGTNFTGATKVEFNGTSATAFTVVSATQITTVMPAGATSGMIAVTTPAGSGTSAASFTVSTTTPKFWTLTVTTNTWDIITGLSVIRTDVIPNVDFGTKKPNVNSDAVWTNLPEGTYLLTLVYSWQPKTETQSVQLKANTTVQYKNLKWN
jgi:type II secretory pathway pseudopilin PulG